MAFEITKIFQGDYLEWDDTKEVVYLGEYGSSQNTDHLRPGFGFKYIKNSSDVFDFIEVSELCIKLTYDNGIIKNSKPTYHRGDYCRAYLSDKERTANSNWNNLIVENSGDPDGDIGTVRDLVMSQSYFYYYNDKDGYTTCNNDTNTDNNPLYVRFIFDKPVTITDGDTYYVYFLPFDRYDTEGNNTAPTDTKEFSKIKPEFPVGYAKFAFSKGTISISAVKASNLGCMFYKKNGTWYKLNTLYKYGTTDQFI